MSYTIGITSITDDISTTPKRKLNDDFNDTSNNVAKLSKEQTLQNAADVVTNSLESMNGDMCVIHRA